MGTAAEKTRRRAAQDTRARVDRWMESGGYTGPESLAEFLRSIGANPYGPIYKEKVGTGAFEGGGGGLQEVYGPSADPMKEYDLHAGLFRWRITGPDGSLKYPDWNPIDPVEYSRIQGFYNWTQSPEGKELAGQHGNSFLAAWYANHGDSPDMSWTGKSYLTPGGGTPIDGGAPSDGASSFASGGDKFLSNVADILLAQANADLQGQLSQLRKTLEGEGIGRDVLDFFADQAFETLGMKYERPEIPELRLRTEGGGAVKPPAPAQDPRCPKGGRYVNGACIPDTPVPGGETQERCELNGGRWIDERCQFEHRDGDDTEPKPDDVRLESADGVSAFGLTPPCAPNDPRAECRHPRPGEGSDPGLVNYCQDHPDDSRFCNPDGTPEPVEDRGDTAIPRAPISGGTPGQGFDITAGAPPRGTITPIDREGLDWRNTGDYARYMPEIEAVASTYAPLLQRGANLLPAGGARNRFLESGTLAMAGNVTDVWRRRAEEARNFLQGYGASMWSGQPMFTGSAASRYGADTSRDIAEMQDATARYGADKQLSAAKWGGLGSVLGGLLGNAKLFCDVRMKKDLEPTGEFLMPSVPLYEFTYNELAGELEGTRGRGPLAQDLEKVRPDLVFEDSRGLKYILVEST